VHWEIQFCIIELTAAKFHAIIYFFQEMLLDLFTYPHGPRVRDKLSHGEADIFTFPKSLCTATFIVVIYFTAKYQPTTIFSEKVCTHNVIVIHMKCLTCYLPLGTPETSLTLPHCCACSK